MFFTKVFHSLIWINKIYNMVTQKVIDWNFGKKLDNYKLLPTMQHIETVFRNIFVSIWSMNFAEIYFIFKLSVINSKINELLWSMACSQDFPNFCLSMVGLKVLCIMFEMQIWPKRYYACHCHRNKCAWQQETNRSVSTCSV